MWLYLSDPAAVDAHAPPMAEGSRIRQVPSLDQEQLYREADPRVWTAAAPWARGKI